MPETPPEYLCPKCRKPGVWRRGGPHFENQMACWHCNEIWVPLEVRDELEMRARELKNQDGGGI